jgi:hypothetical protein
MPPLRIVRACSHVLLHEEHADDSAQVCAIPSTTISTQSLPMFNE